MKKYFEVAKAMLTDSMDRFSYGYHLGYTYALYDAGLLTEEEERELYALRRKLRDKYLECAYFHLS